MQTEWKSIRAQIQESNILNRVNLGFNHENGILEMACWIQYLEANGYSLKGTTIEELNTEVNFLIKSSEIPIISSMFEERQGLLIVHEALSYEPKSISLKKLIKLFGNEKHALSYFISVLNRKGIGFIFEDTEMYGLQTQFEMNEDVRDEYLEFIRSNPKDVCWSVSKDKESWSFEKKPKRIRNKTCLELIEKWEKFDFNIHHYELPEQFFEDGHIPTSFSFIISLNGEYMPMRISGYESDNSDFFWFSVVDTCNFDLDQQVTYELAIYGDKKPFDTPRVQKFLEMFYELCNLQV